MLVVFASVGKSGIAGAAGVVGVAVFSSNLSNTEFNFGSTTEGGAVGVSTTGGTAGSGVVSTGAGPCTLEGSLTVAVGGGVGVA